MAGLAPANIRLTDAEPNGPANDAGVVVQLADDAPDQAQTDDAGAILQIKHGDGSLTVSLDGKPISDPARSKSKEGWFADLSDQIDDHELSRIADDLLRGIAEDIESRKDWTESIATGIQLLGLKIEVPGLQGATDGAPVEGMSKVRHSLLLEACLRFQANARSELLPTDGPVKVRNDENQSDTNLDQLADALEQDLNHYLTAVATEYYPDTDRMLLRLGFAGMAFKKVYRCPLRMRPVSETVDADDLIVNNAATDLANAKRVTHKVQMRPSVARRMQILGVYRDVPLDTPKPADLDSAQREAKAQQGVAAEATNPEDRDREIYECYCELDIKGFEHKWKGEASGLEIPYRVTIDVSSRQILSIVRNYNQTDTLPEPRKRFVAYVYVPGFGFYGLGLLHILGNLTNAITAASREMLDNGMYANFPGFLISKQASRQNTNIVRVPPGGAQQIDTGGMSMSDAVMPLPYNTQQMPPLMALVQYLAETGARLGGTAEIQVGEGRQDAPVGTTLALIDQATKLEDAVHKRLHAAQAEEFTLLVECFREDPQSFWAHSCPSRTAWTEQTFLQALNSCNLVPQADPNTASHLKRMMKAMGLKQLQAASPSLYDPIAVDTFVLQTAGIGNPQQFFTPPQAQAQPPPEVQEIQAGIATAKQIADAKTTEANAKMAQANAKIEEAKAKAAQGGLGSGQSPLDGVEAKAKLMDAETRKTELGLKAHEIEAETRDRALDREAEDRSNAIDLAKTVMGHAADAEAAANEVKPIERKIGASPAAS